MNALRIVCLIIISGCTGVLLGSTLAEVYWTIRKASRKRNGLVMSPAPCRCWKPETAGLRPELLKKANSFVH